MPQWKVPVDEWHGEAAFILGGGPSLRGFDAEQLRGRGRIIAVNDAGLHMAPWADMLFFADRRWLEWNADKLHLHQGRIVSRRRPAVMDDIIYWLSFTPGRLSTNPHEVGGLCGGSSAINIAYLLGASPIVLLGFDMRPGNWHENHKRPPARNSHAFKFIPALEKMAPALEGRVLNATPGSALTCFPMASLEDIINGQRLAFVPPADREESLPS